MRPRSNSVNTENQSCDELLAAEGVEAAKVGGETKIRAPSYEVIPVVETLSLDRAEITINLVFLFSKDAIIGAAVDVRHNP